MMYLLRALLLVLAAVASAHADYVTVPARALSYRHQAQAWARVESVAPLVLRMPLAARVARVAVVQGQAVSAGTPLVWLSGPQLASQLAIARARVVAARHEMAAARDSAASVKRSYPAFADRRALAAAQSALAAARGKLAEAKASEQSLRVQSRLASPLPAVVSAISAAPGTDLPAGAPLLTLLPQGHLWLRAEFFGPLPAGSGAGRFIPDDGQAVDVRLVNELPARAANGARILNFAASGTAPVWQAGETGKLILYGPSRPAVAVPAGALILDAGRWFVLTESDGKLTARRVTPGPARGNEVLVLAGLKPGVPVVVRQAYLLYHRGFSAHYMPPD
jgi:multidrug efflux pump subunit AcrA (membrane-fusion protein)